MPKGVAKKIAKKKAKKYPKAGRTRKATRTEEANYRETDKMFSGTHAK